MVGPGTTPMVTLVLLDGFQNPLQEWTMNVSHIRQSITRTPVLIGLPSAGLDPHISMFACQHLPHAWALDLGLIQEMFEFTGQCNDWEEQDPSTTLPPMNISMLQHIARVAGTGISSDNKHTTFDKIGAAGGVIMHVNPGHNTGAQNDAWVIKGMILSLSSEREAGVLTWDYILRVGVSEWTLLMSGIPCP